MKRISIMLRRHFLPLLAQELPSIRVDVNLVNLPFSVMDARGQLVLSLTKDDIEVLEDGVSQTISHFSDGTASTLSLGLIADASGSQKDFGEVDQLAGRLQEFQGAKHTDGYPIVGPQERRTSGTAFYDAIYHSVEDILSKVDGGRRVLIIFSDGEDNASAQRAVVGAQ